MKYVLVSTMAVLMATTVQAQEVSEDGAQVIASIEEACEVFDYEEECFREMGRAVTAAEPLSEQDQEAVYVKIRSYAERRPQWADAIARILPD